MGVNIIERIQAKIELFRLEQRYTRRRNRRSTFVSNAVYVDGEYIYNTPASTGSSTATTATAASSAATPSKNRSRLNRWSSVPGFGSSKSDVARGQDWRTNQVSVREVR